MKVLVVTAVFGLFFVFKGITLLLMHAPEPIGSRADLLMLGAQMTLQLTVVAGLIGLVLGVLLGLGKLSSLKLFRYPSAFVVWIIQGTPLMVQILFIYFALPGLIPSLSLNDFSAGVLALAINVGAYNAEVIRAGILAVPKGQTEAAKSLGLSHFKTLRFVVLPQAFRIVLPPLVNNIVALLKDSSLVSAIGLVELSLSGSRISSETFQPVPVLTTVAFIYLILTTVLTLFASQLESCLRGAKR